MSAWSIALAFGISMTRPSDVRVDARARGDAATFHRVRWSGLPFVPSPWYSVRIAYGSLAIDYTHEKIYAATQDVVHESGTWHGERVDDDVRLDQRVQHLEVTHGLNVVAVVALLRDPSRRALYGGVGPVVYIAHTESTIDEKPRATGYDFGGFGLEALAGIGDAHHRYVDVKADRGAITVRVDGGTATTPVQTVNVELAP